MNHSRFQAFFNKHLPLSESEDSVLRSVFSILPTDPVIARSEATRQSLTKRFAIPKRTMAERNETEPWNEERGSGTKQQISRFFITGIPFCFVFPCFATGCHTINFKIATAALRPRNDTKLRRFYLENGRFFFYAFFFARCRSAAFFRRFVPKIVPFSRKTDQFCHCEERSDAAIFNAAICHSETNYGRAERNRALERRKRKRNEAAKLLFL